MACIPLINKTSISNSSLIPPNDDFSLNYRENEIIIITALKESNVFDKQLNFNEKDRLQIVLSNIIANREEFLKRPISKFDQDITR